MKRLLALAFGSLLVTSGLACANPINLFVNPTFATSAAGWTPGLNGGCLSNAQILASQVTGGAGDGSGWGYQSVVGDPPGSYLLNECGTSGFDPSLAQTVTGLTIGDTYEVSVNIKLFDSGASGTGKTFGIFLNSEPSDPIGFGEGSSVSSWNTVMASFVAGSTTETIIFASELDARTPGGPGFRTDVSEYIDNASLEDLSGSSGAVPEPASLLLFGSGLLAIARRLSGWRSQS